MTIEAVARHFFSKQGRVRERTILNLEQGAAARLRALGEALGPVLRRMNRSDRGEAFKALGIPTMEEWYRDRRLFAKHSQVFSRIFGGGWSKADVNMWLREKYYEDYPIAEYCERAPGRPYDEETLVGSMVVEQLIERFLEGLVKDLGLDSDGLLDKVREAPLKQTQGPPASSPADDMPYDMRLKEKRRAKVEEMTRRAAPFYTIKTSQAR